MSTVVVFLLEMLANVLDTAAGMGLALIILTHFGYRVRVERQPSRRDQ